ncbi:MAG: TusE/DsrC/DsvC family sulfur relay protein [Proteobacteria bacterium]|nr:TusE/DsrC/DsvC family sulfur relay protein [Pseudomonadota bacterium]
MDEIEESKPLSGLPTRKARVIGGREIDFDGEGFFRNADDWSAEIAEMLARESGLADLVETHWRVIRFMRDYYANYGRAPMNRHLKEGIGMSLMEIEGLFPGGIRAGARRLAGLPNPKACM